MEDPSTAVREAVERCAALREASVLVLLSGGADSACLLHALAERGIAHRICALHVNHGLRGDAHEDERACGELCAALGVDIEVRRARLGRGNVQAAAREARYLLAEEVRAERGLDLVATAHTASDQIETVLHRLASSPGRRALLGMAQRRDRLVRPLLDVTRDQTRAHCRAVGIEFRDDPSNADLRFARNRIRHSLLPVLRSIHPAAEDNILATRDELEDEGAALDEMADALLVGAAESAADSLAAEALAPVSGAVRRLVMRRMAERALGRPVPMSRGRADEIWRLAGAGGSRELDLPGVRAVCEYGRIRFEPSPAARVGVADPPPPVALPVPGSCRLGQWTVRSDRAETRSPATKRDSFSAVFDLGLTGTDILVRSWRDGDRIRPLGMEGSRKLQDVFTDGKVPRAHRRDHPIVVARGRIAWVPGHAVSREFAAREGTAAAVRLTALREPSTP